MQKAPLDNTVSSYKVIDKIITLPGEVLSKGEDLSSGAPVFIKTHTVSTLSKALELENRFSAVLEKISKFKHQNIVSLVGGEVAKGVFTSVFEYVPGEWLNEYLHRVDLDSIPIYTKMDFLKGLAQGVSYLHAQGLIAGTIFPANILVSSRTGKSLILDPGISHVCGIAVTGNSSHMTPYLAPEVITGRSMSPASDVYSLATISFQLLTKERAFFGQSTNSAMSAMSGNERRRIIDFLPGSTLEVDKVFEIALNEIASKRYRSVEEYIEALDSSLKSCKLLTENQVINFKSETEAVWSEKTKDIKRKKAKKKNIDNTKSTKNRSQPILLQGMLLLSLLFLIGLTIWMIINWESDQVILTDLESPEVVVGGTVTNGIVTSINEGTVNDKNSKSAINGDEVAQTTSYLDPAKITDSKIPTLTTQEINGLIQDLQTGEGLGLKLLNEVIKRKELLSQDFLNSAFRSSHYKVKINTLKALEKDKNALQAAPSVLVLSTDEDSLVRGFAAKTIGLVAGEDVLAELMSWESQEKDKQVREVVRESVKVIRNRTKH